MRARAAVLAITVGLVAFIPSARADGECRITGGHATVLVRESTADPAPVYEGAMFVLARDCGDGPLTITGTFAPVGGTPATCFSQPSSYNTLNTNENRASCAFSGSVGVGLSGTPVVIEATAEMAGVVKDADWIGGGPPPADEGGDARIDPETDGRSGSCVLPMPETNARSTCSLF
jgi:hypothetical protein